MSSALVRQALDFVDQEESNSSRRGVGGCGAGSAGKRRRAAGQGALSHTFQPNRRKNKKPKIKQSKSSEQIAEENIKKLLALSKPTADKQIAEKIVERAIKRKPLLEKIETKVEEEKSILFPDEPPESFKKFESEYFCS